MTSNVQTSLIVQLLFLIRLLDNLQSFLDRVEIENDTTIFGLKAFALQIQALDLEEYQIMSQSFSVDLGSVEEAMKLEERIEERNLITSDAVIDAVIGATASMELSENPPQSLNSFNLTNLTSAGVQRLSYSVYLSDTLFQNVNQSHLKIGSIIIAARLSHQDNATINTSVHTTFKIDPKVIE